MADTCGQCVGYRYLPTETGRITCPNCEGTGLEPERSPARHPYPNAVRALKSIGFMGRLKLVIAVLVVVIIVSAVR